jgi:hypothetical protein
VSVPADDRDLQQRHGNDGAVRLLVSVLRGDAREGGHVQGRDCVHL